MDMNDYAIEMLAGERLREARVDAARRALIARHRHPRPTLRGRLGAALIALGERLAAGPAHGRSCATPGASHG
jgi:hypothetical protein